MAIDKNKILANAQKLIQKGQWDKALKEYKTLADAFPNDYAVRLKIGELYSKLGQNDAAIEELIKVADSYTKTGFYSRSVAVYKQALKIDESRSDLFVALGELYQKLQLAREATSQFRIAVNHFEKEGNTEEALKILRKMLEIEPSLGTRAKIAELNFKLGRQDEARKEFKQIADDIRKDNRPEDLIHFLERVVSIIPESRGELLELAKIYVERNEPEKALARIKVLIESGKRDEEVLATLAGAYQLQGKADRVKSVYKEMLRLFKDEGNQQKLKETAEAILKIDPKDFEAQEVIGKKAAAPPPPPAAAPKPAAPAATRITPTTPSAPSGPARAAAPPAGDAGGANRYVTEADIFLKYGLKSKAIDSLQQVLKRDPGNEAVRKKLVELQGEVGPAEAPRAAAPAVEAPPAPEKAEPGLKPGFDFRLPSEEAPAPAAKAPAAPAAAPAGTSDGIEIEFSAGSFIKGPEVELPAEPKASEPAQAPVASIEEDIEFDTEEKPAAPAAAPEISISLPDLTAPTLEIGEKIGEVAAPAAPEEEGVGPAEVEEELDEAEFYLQQGLQDEAAKIYRRVLKTKPDEKRALDRLRQIETGTVSAEAEPEVPAEPEAPAEAEKEMETETEAEAPPPAAVASPEKVLETQGGSFFTSEPAESQEEGFDLAHELEEELEAELPEEAPSAEEGPSFDDIFSEFKKGVEREISLDDTQAHYDLGIAYKEMGLLDDAIQELMVAKSDPDKEADCYNLIGIIYSQKGMMEKAIEFYVKGLKSPSISKTGAIELSYELGVAYQAIGKVGEALRVFERITRNDPEFRDVQQRIAELKGEAPAPAAEEEAAPAEEAVEPEAAEAEAPAPKPAAPEKVRQKKISFV